LNNVHANSEFELSSLSEGNKPSSTRVNPTPMPTRSQTIEWHQERKNTGDTLLSEIRCFWGGSCKRVENRAGDSISGPRSQHTNKHAPGLFHIAMRDRKGWVGKACKRFSATPIERGDTSGSRSQHNDKHASLPFHIAYQHRKGWVRKVLHRLAGSVGRDNSGA
jgi:hypothetical protein